MQNIPDKELDNLFRNLADKHNIQFDEEAWQKMEKKLDQSRRERYMIYFFKGLGLLGVGGLIFFLAVLFSSDKDMLVAGSDRDSLKVHIEKNGGSSLDEGTGSTQVNENARKIHNSRPEKTSHFHSNAESGDGSGAPDKIRGNKDKESVNSIIVDHRSQNPARKKKYGKEETFKEIFINGNVTKEHSNGTKVGGQNDGKPNNLGKRPATAANNEPQELYGNSAFVSDTNLRNQKAKGRIGEIYSGEYAYRGSKNSGFVTGKLNEDLPPTVALPALHLEDDFEGTRKALDRKKGISPENKTGRADSALGEKSDQSYRHKTTEPVLYANPISERGKTGDIYREERQAEGFKENEGQSARDQSGNMADKTNLINEDENSVKNSHSAVTNIHSDNEKLSGMDSSTGTGNSMQGIGKDRNDATSEMRNSISNDTLSRNHLETKNNKEKEDSVKTLLTDTLTEAKEKIGKDREEKKNRRYAGRWSWGVMVAPDFSSVGFFQMEKPGVAKGVFTEYHLSSRWSLMTALVLTSKIYSTPGGEAYKYGYGYKKVKLKSVDGNCSVLDIPLSIKFNILNSPKNKFYASGGFSSYFMLYEKYSYVYEDTRYNTSEEYKNRNSNFFSILNGGLGYERFISRSFSVQAEPFFKLPLNQVGEKKLKLLTTGVFFYLKYTL